MRSALVLWLVEHGFPAWFAPDYAVTVGLAGLLGAAWFLRLARADRADVDAEKRALAIAYLAALAGGYVFEALRALPAALSTGSWDALLDPGRAAYGGLLAAILASIVYVRHRRLPIAPFLDRCTVVMGVSFAFVRTGCFLAGCDYGRPTAGPLGVRFPAGSPAAIDHAALGWVREGAPSLPVHATQLYEAAIGLGATLIALALLRRGHRDGRAFLAWIATYAAGRFANEFLRGDTSRGLYAGLSTAQIVSLSLLAMVAIAWHRRWALRAVPAAIAAALLLSGDDVHAQTTAPPQYQPHPQPAPLLLAPDAAPQPDAQAASNQRRVEVRAAVGPAFTLGNARAPTGGVTEIAGFYRFPFARRHRFQLGLELRGYRNSDATHVTAGLPLELVLGAASRLEFNLSIVPGHTWVFFDSPFFSPTNAWGSRFEFGLRFPVGDRVAIGASPLSVNVLSSQTIGVISTYEPRVSVVVGFL